MTCEFTCDLAFNDIIVLLKFTFLLVMWDYEHFDTFGIIHNVW